MPTVHLICGRVGAGKTTYGRQLSKDRRIPFFALDEWMAALFLADSPQPITLDWALVRTERCEAQIWAVCRQLFALDLDVAIEVGGYKRDQRDRIRQIANDTGAQLVIHSLIVDPDVRRERVRARNRGSATFSVEVDDAMFDWAEAYFEDLTDDELVEAVVVAGER
jgi:predicted kinase